MALEVDYQYHTYSRNVILRDQDIETYECVDVRPCGGVQFDVHLMTEGGSGPQVDLHREGFRGVIEVVKYDVDDSDDDFLDFEPIWSHEVTFNHVTDPEHFDVDSDDAWNELAMDSVESLLRDRERARKAREASQIKEDPPPVVRKTRYEREEVI
jgi:hypothetical protein